MEMNDANIMNDNKCIICGRLYKSANLQNLTFTPKPLVDRNDCYRIYKKLLGVYGTAYIDLLSSF
jgi:hypothetical protein